MRLFEASRAGEVLKQLIGTNIKGPSTCAISSKSHASLTQQPCQAKSDVNSLLCSFSRFLAVRYEPIPCRAFDKENQLGCKGSLSLVSLQKKSDLSGL
ncbi:hypothetical protein RFM26_29160 [Mesorhizobium sp. VK23B]|uniref:Uncharacterized protein n=1 Tax=Mesorhizobium dulcispinae TaxID=3072316 RepID=A0ABU4XMX0_9HYPH|nr:MULTISPECIES: hypothetical protein [unclassified Mesorhizobium]MDX8469763.1 hypothetical protein [Mesorhizobium sp. VK23B]MDX8476102.1 hypothetical protein [Mesorhizobium sp. VK23A]